MTSNVNNGSSVPSGPSNGPSSGPINGPTTGPTTGPTPGPTPGPLANPLIGPPRPMDIGINMEPAVDSTRKRKQDGFETGWVKKPKQGSVEDNRTQEQKDKETIKSLRITMSSWYNQPRGKDFAPRLHMLGELNSKCSALLVLRSKGVPVVPGNMESWSREVRVKFDMYSQVPSLKIWLDDDNSFSIRAQNVTSEDRPRWTQTSGYKLDLSDAQIEKSKADLADLFLKTYRCPIQAPINTIVELVKYGATVKTLSFLGMDIVGKFFWETRSSNNQDPRYGEMDAFMTQLNQGVMHATIVRAQLAEKSKLYDLVDNHWIHLMEQCNRYGVYRWYNGSIGFDEGKLFEAWQEKTMARVQHQPWMRLREMDSSLAAYASHGASYTFGSLREMEIALSVGVIGETMWEDFSILKYFNIATKHECLVDRQQDYVRLHVQVEKDENFAMPAVTSGTRMRFWVVPLEVDENAEAPAPPDEDEWIKVKGKKIRKPVMPPTGWMPEDQETKCRVIEVETQVDFVLGFRCKDDNSRNAFKKGNRMEVWIDMERNPVPTNRMLKAIGRICSPPKNATEANQQSFLMGHGVLDEGPAIHAVCQDKMTSDQREAFNLLTRSMRMNKQQLEAWRLTFYEAVYACFIQGPPGTGKTEMVGGQGVGLALCGVRTLITAPSNIAAREVMNKLASKMDLVAEVFPQVRELFDIVYLPTRGTTISDMKESDIDWDEASMGMINEGENQTGMSDVDDFALWKHIVKAMKEDKDNGADAEKKQRATNWLDTLHKFKTGQGILSADKKRFAKVSEAVATEILSSVTSKVKLVICTSNTADLLHTYGYKPQVCIGDEAAFGFETDLWIPLSLGTCTKIINVGDHMQLHPVVKSHGHSEYSKQYGLSMFARFFNHHSVRTAKFRMNYRMPKEIAEVPGLCSYGYLGSHPCTERETETFKYIKQWWNSDSAKSYRDAQRDPAYGGQKVLQVRRLFMNVKGGKSAPKPGGKSKRNFANINAIRELLMNLFAHQQTDDLEKIDLDKITVLTPYKEELGDLTKQITVALRASYPGIKRFPRFRTIDSTQGGQNQLVLLGITPADQYNGAIIGFLNQWNRLNVGLTRAQSSLFIFGNLDVWRSQLPVLVRKCKNFGFMVIDILDRGDIVDIEGINALPTNKQELLAGPQAYTMEIEVSRASDSKLSASEQKALIGWVKEDYEKDILEQWQAKKLKAVEYQSKDEMGIDFELPVFGVEEDKKAEDDVIDDLSNTLETSKVSDEVGPTSGDVQMDGVDPQDLQTATANSLVTNEAELKKRGVDVTEDSIGDFPWENATTVADSNPVEESSVVPLTPTPQAVEASVPPPPAVPHVIPSAPRPPPAVPHVIPSTAPLSSRPTGPQPYQTTPPLFNTPGGAQGLTGNEPYIHPRPGSGFQPPPPAFNNGQQSPFGPGGRGGVFNGPPNRGNFNNGPPAPGGFNDSQRGDSRGGRGDRGDRGGRGGRGGRGDRGNRSGSGGFGPGNSDRGGSSRGWRNDSWRRS